MNRHVCLLTVVMLSVAVAFSSCFGDDDDDYDDYCYISGFTLGTLKRTMFTYTSEGADSAYSTSFSGSSFPMTIDHRALTIENLDSLPRHTQLSKVLCTITYEGSLAWRKADIAGLSDTTWTSYDSSDSLDLSEPLHFASIAGNGNSYRTYTLKVNKHQQTGDTCAWTALGQSAVLASMGERKAFVWGDVLAVIGNSDDELVYAQHPLSASGEWDSFATSGASGADVTTLCQQGNALYMSTASGDIITSTNAVDWSAADYPSATGLRLAGASEARLYALLDGEMVSSDGGEWETEALDDTPDFLPTEQIHSFAYTTGNGLQHLLLVGARDNDSDLTCQVWQKAWSTDEARATWMYYPENDADSRRLPVMPMLNIVPYDGGFLAMGGATRDGQYEAMDSVLLSVDQGVAWRPYENDDMVPSDEMKEAAASASHITAAVDEEQFLYVIIDDRTWRGRINRLAWARQD